jgi:carboxyl-terminal processing protease
MHAAAHRSLALGMGVCLCSSVIVSAQVEKDHLEALRKLTAVFAAIEAHYADRLDSDQLIYRGAIPGALRTLDPYSVFFDPAQFYQLKQQQQARAEGFGTIVSVIPGRVVVLEAQIGSPAARSGIQPGDEIVEINGHRIEYLEVEQLVELLSETRRATASLRLMRAGSAALESITVSPAEMSQPSVDRTFLLQPGVGYIKMTGFEATSAEELRAAIEKLRAKGMRALVLDLRENHGGLVDIAVTICGYFLKPGTLVLTAKGRAQPEKQHKVAADAATYDFPLAVLVSHRTASAAEIFAGAMQDHRRATVLGTQTFGKGVVQGVFPLSQNTGLALATAQYFTPSGRSIQKPFPGFKFATASGPGGITPDRVVLPAGVNDWQAYLENGSAFLDFARGYVALNRNAITGKFEVGAEVLDLFKAWLRQKDAAFTEAIFSANTPWIRHRLKVEIFNLALGVAQGDEIAAAGDQQIQAAIAALEK